MPPFTLKDEILFSIIRQKLYEYLMRMRTEEGAFKMHEGGEVDIRFAAISFSHAITTFY